MSDSSTRADDIDAKIQWIKVCGNEKGSVGGKGCLFLDILCLEELARMRMLEVCVLVHLMLCLYMCVCVRVLCCLSCMSPCVRAHVCISFSLHRLWTISCVPKNTEMRSHM